MYMSDWVAKLDDFLKLSGRELLTHAGKISHEQALTRAQIEYEKYRALLINHPSAVESHFDVSSKITVSRVYKRWKIVLGHES